MKFEEKNAHNPGGYGRFSTKKFVKKTIFRTKLPYRGVANLLRIFLKYGEAVFVKLLLTYTNFHSIIVTCNFVYFPFGGDKFANCSSGGRDFCVRNQN